MQKDMPTMKIKEGRQGVDLSLRGGGHGLVYCIILSGFRIF